MLGVSCSAFSLNRSGVPWRTTVMVQMYSAQKHCRFHSLRLRKTKARELRSGLVETTGGLSRVATRERLSFKKPINTRATQGAGRSLHLR